MKIVLAIHRAPRKGTSDRRIQSRIERMIGSCCHKKSWQSDFQTNYSASLKQDVASKQESTALVALVYGMNGWGLRHLKDQRIAGITAWNFHHQSLKGSLLHLPSTRLNLTHYSFFLHVDLPTLCGLLSCTMTISYGSFLMTVFKELLYLIWMHSYLIVSQLCRVAWQKRQEFWRWKRTWTIKR